ncbi:MAG TPA: hypothetical protein VK988_10575 [Acidimicrobiales bacterium]|nr:hypothetical protein [Acidimicrobiales bacterium]
MNRLVRVWGWLVAAHAGWLAERESEPESGQAVNEWLGLSALAIVAIVAIGAVLKTLGVDIIEWIRSQLGL